MTKLLFGFYFFSHIVMTGFLHAKSHPFNAEDIWSMHRLSSPALSPDGKKLAYVQKTYDLPNDTSSKDIYLINLSGKSTPIRMTSHKASDSTPIWSKSGDFLYFLSSREGSSQIWKINIAGGEAQQVSDLPLSVETFKLSPDNQHIAITLNIFPDCKNIMCSKKRMESKKKNKSSAQIYSNMFVRHWDQWEDERRSHLFVLNLSKSGKVSGEPLDIIPTLDTNVPSRPFGGSEEYNFSQDSKHLFFTARLANAQEPWSTNFDIYQASVDAKTPLKNLSKSNPAWDSSPIASPDGQHLAYLSMQRAGFEADRFQLNLLNLKTGKLKKVAKHWDRSIGSFTFYDKNTILAIAQDTGNKLLFSIKIGNSKVKKLVKKGYVSGLSVRGKKIVYGLNNLKSPTEFYTNNIRGKKSKKISQVNAAKLANLQMGDFEQFKFKGWNNEDVYGYIVQPINFDSKKKYPLAFIIHGGPQGSSSNRFHYRWNPQTYTAAGYAVVMIDFHGSTGYGQAFTDSISGDWGGKPLEDLQKGMAHALKEYSWIDNDRKCALGASYGGYMINWIAGNWPDQFQCLVNHDGVFDMRSMYYTTEELWFVEWEQGGPYFLNPSQHEKHNPVNYVKNWKAPMLVIQGQLDYRVPLGQSIGAFTALQRQGIDSKFIYFPDENHWILNGHNGLLWHKEVIAWLDKYLK